LLPVKDEGKKKGFKLYYNEEMYSKGQKVEVVNYPRNRSLLFSGKNLVKKPYIFYAITF